MMPAAKSQASAQRGFTLIETMIAIVIMSIGIIAMLAVFATAVATTQNAQENLIARQKALETMESIYTARNTQQISFAQIANIASGGIFTNGATPLLSAGPDGLVNTADDVNFPAAGACPAGPECITLPGPDGILGTADDTAMSLANFTPPDSDRKRARERRSYGGPQSQTDHGDGELFHGCIDDSARSYKVNALISAFR